MKFALSTNWCNTRIDDPSRIADEALSLGFDALELGYRTTESQAEGFSKISSRIVIGSVHAFCPLPMSAPRAHPELYALADPDPEARALAVLMTKRSIESAAAAGASTVVVHAGSVPLSSFLSPLDSAKLDSLLVSAGGDVRARKYMKALSLARRRRIRAAARAYDAFRDSFSALTGCLEENSVTLALENLPYIEAFPDENEMKSLLSEFDGAPLASWFDTGHDLVRRSRGLTRPGRDFAFEVPHRGMHINDVVGLCDDHLAPGGGNVDFAALGPLARTVRHVVFEPSPAVSREDLAASLARIRGMWE